MNYIRYHEVENLFKLQPTLEAILESISVDLVAASVKEVTGTSEEYIYNLCIGNKELKDTPPTSKISDTTSTVAANYAKIMQQDKNYIKNQLGYEALEISLVIDKLNIAFRRLTPLQQTILKLYYWKELTWKEILEQIKEEGQYISLRHAQDLRKAGIEKMVNISKITIKTYQNILTIVQGSLPNNKN